MVNVANAGIPACRTVALHTARPVYRPVVLKWLNCQERLLKIFFFLYKTVDRGRKDEPVSNNLPRKPVYIMPWYQFYISLLCFTTSSDQKRLLQLSGECAGTCLYIRAVWKVTNVVM